MTAAFNRLAARAVALLFAVAFTSATLAAIDALAQLDRAAAQLVHASSSVARG